MSVENVRERVCREQLAVRVVPIGATESLGYAIVALAASQPLVGYRNHQDQSLAKVDQTEDVRSLLTWTPLLAIKYRFRNPRAKTSRVF